MFSQKYSASPKPGYATASRDVNDRHKNDRFYVKTVCGPYVSKDVFKVSPQETIGLRTRYLAIIAASFQHSSNRRGDGAWILSPEEVDYTRWWLKIVGESRQIPRFFSAQKNQRLPSVILAVYEYIYGDQSLLRQSDSRFNSDTNSQI